MSEIHWHGDQVMREVQGAIGNNLEKAALFLVDKLKQKVSTAPATVKRYVGKKGVYYIGIPTSAPGDPPHMVTGFLRNSITYEMAPDRLSVRVGTNDKVGFWLEMGTVKTAARPWLRPTFAEHATTLGRIIATGRK